MEMVENQKFSFKMANRIQKMQKKPSTKQTWIGAWGKNSLPKKKSIQHTSPEDLFSAHADFQ